MRPVHCTSGIGVSTSVPRARAVDTTNSNGVLIFARYASRDQNSGEYTIVFSTARISPSLDSNVLDIRATSDWGGVSDTNRRASFVEINFAVLGCRASSSIT